MKQIFISHNTKNKELVESIIELFQGGMGIGRERIFCSSSSGNLATGKDFPEKIREKISGSDVVVSVITPEYLKSPFCMMELGAAWVISSGVYPILADGIDYKDLDNTPLKSVQMRKCDKEDDWFAIYDEFVTEKIIEKPETSLVSKKIPEYFNKMRHYLSGEDVIIKADENGYYEVRVMSKRNVPPVYRCYRISGRLDLHEPGQSIAEDMKKNVGHWIFFKAGVYDDLEVNDLVRLKVDSTELKKFEDIGYARNIYPAELEVK